jgi:hypothetical protein
MKETHPTEEDQTSFESRVRDAFPFLEDIGQMKFVGVRVAGGSAPRDSALVARYVGDHLRLEVGWNEMERSLAVLFRFEREDLGRIERYIYFEPFVEFLTNGQTKAIVPYVREGMSLTQLKMIVDGRKMVFNEGFTQVIKKLGAKMSLFFGRIRTTSSEDIRGYHAWMKSAGRFDSFTP